MKTKMIAGAAALLLLCVVGCSNGSEGVVVTDFVYEGKQWCSTSNGLSYETYVHIEEGGISDDAKAYAIRLRTNGTADIQTAAVNSGKFTLSGMNWEELDYTADEGADEIVITLMYKNTETLAGSYTFTMKGSDKYLITKTVGLFDEQANTEFSNNYTSY